MIEVIREREMIKMRGDSVMIETIIMMIMIEGITIITQVTWIKVIEVVVKEETTILME